ncbi:hypothetical protein SUDANB120_06026 [Streptomyces sp. enrichment culture]|uniref:hypothetical protein n=1 Tax=Streptomyces TaxID=1883 RepID=UPI001673BACF|nr:MULTISPECIES: hypothetical protein [Streptomyces]MBD3577596.1 hypothetical protein [Streptomyces sp. KD18]GGT09671.1 hypothetical protein GCM10010286_38950 [Streptomyces toxytricini]
MKSLFRTISVVALAFGTAWVGNGAAVAAASSGELPVVIRCNNPANLAAVDASGGDSLVRQLISLASEGNATNDGSSASGVITGSGGEAVGGDASQSTNNNRCGESSGLDVSTRIDNSRRVDNSRTLDIDNGPGLL